MTVKKAKNTDAKKLTELTIQSKSYWNYSPEQIEEWRDELTITEKYIKENQVYKLVDDDKFIGYYAYQSLNKTDLKLTFLFIAPEFIKQGYGKLLMTNFLQRVENSEYKKIILDADPNAEEFYKRLGFRVIGQLESSIKDRVLPIMIKDI